MDSWSGLLSFVVLFFAVAFVPGVRTIELASARAAEIAIVPWNDLVGITIRTMLHAALHW